VVIGAIILLGVVTGCYLCICRRKKKPSDGMHSLPQLMSLL
jgi:hypothetical protein